jgi:nitrogen-specific signal transduction histidine kinase
LRLVPDIFASFERERLEKNLLLTDRLASIGVMATGLAHDVASPLTYVLSNVAFAAEELAKLGTGLNDAGMQSLQEQVERIREALADALQGMQQVDGIMRGVRNFSRGGEDEGRGPVDLHRVLQMAVKMTANQTRHTARISRDFRPVPTVQGNAAKLGQVFVNLLLNAAQAMPDENVEKNEIALVTQTDEQGRAVLEVRDTGCGIDCESLGLVFEPFYTTKPAGIGTGLGLAICRKIIAEIGGEITVQSSPGKGSVFTVVLPAAVEQEIQPQPAAPPTGAKRARILVVDDDPIISTAIQRILTDQHQVSVVLSGREALKLLHSNPEFDLILCDLMMPEVSGIDLYQELRRSLPLLSSRMVFLTGGAYTPEAVRFLNSVGNPRLEKPFNPLDLRSLIGNQLS